MGDLKNQAAPPVYLAGVAVLIRITSPLDDIVEYKIINRVKRDFVNLFSEVFELDYCGNYTKAPRLVVDSMKVSGITMETKDGSTVLLLLSPKKRYLINEWDKLISKQFISYLEKVDSLIGISVDEPYVEMKLKDDLQMKYRKESGLCSVRVYPSEFDIIVAVVLQQMFGLTYQGVLDAEKDLADNGSITLVWHVNAVSRLSIIQDLASLGLVAELVNDTYKLTVN